MEGNIQKNLVRVSYLYLSSRNIYNMGYLSYGNFRNLIRYVIGSYEPKIIRFIFSRLLSCGAIQRKKFGKSVRYIWNPNNKEYKYKPQLFF